VTRQKIAIRRVINVNLWWDVVNTAARPSTASKRLQQGAQAV
jgi:hypothetical protein